MSDQPQQPVAPWFKEWYDAAWKVKNGVKVTLSEREYNHLREELDATREKLQLALEALRHIADDGCHDPVLFAKNQLARIEVQSPSQDKS